MQFYHHLFDGHYENCGGNSDENDDACLHFYCLSNSSRLQSLIIIKPAIKGGPNKPKDKSYNHQFGSPLNSIDDFGFEPSLILLPAQRRCQGVSLVLPTPIPIRHSQCPREWAFNFFFNLSFWIQSFFFIIIYLISGKKTEHWGLLL